MRAVGRRSDRSRCPLGRRCGWRSQWVPATVAVGLTDGSRMAGGHPPPGRAQWRVGIPGGKGSRVVEEAGRAPRGHGENGPNGLVSSWSPMATTEQCEAVACHGDHRSRRRGHRARPQPGRRGRVRGRGHRGAIVDDREYAFAADPRAVLALDLTIVEHGRLVKLDAPAMDGLGKGYLVGVEEVPARMASYVLRLVPQDVKYRVGGVQDTCIKGEVYSDR